MRNWACWAISAPWSQVKDRRSCRGRVVIDSRAEENVMSTGSQPFAPPDPGRNIAAQGWQGVRVRAV